MKKIVSVIGNGESRIGFDIGQMKQFGDVVGCNAIARDYELDHYIAVDKRVCQEVANLTQNKNIPVYTRADWHASFSFFPNVKLVPDLPYQDKNRWDKPFHWGSGPYALLLACTLNPDIVFVIGCDLWGIEEDRKRENNIYKGTACYAPRKDAVDPSYWIKQFKKCFEIYNQTRFIYITPDKWTKPEEWEGLKNLYFDTYQGLNKWILKKKDNQSQ